MKKTKSKLLSLALTTSVLATSVFSGGAVNAAPTGQAMKSESNTCVQIAGMIQQNGKKADKKKSTFPMYFEDNANNKKLAFCVEPSIDTYGGNKYDMENFIQTEEQLGEDLDKNGNGNRVGLFSLTTDQKSSIAKYAYYATKLYNENTDTKTKTYAYAAGQIKIWDAVGADFKNATYQYYVVGGGRTTTTYNEIVNKLEQELQQSDADWYFPEELELQGKNFKPDTTITVEEKDLRNGIEIKDTGSGENLSKYYKLAENGKDTRFDISVAGNTISIKLKDGVTLTSDETVGIKFEGTDKLLPLDRMLLCVEAQGETGKYQRLVTYDKDAVGIPLMLSLNITREPVEVEISKVNQAGEEIEGAKIEIQDEQGHVVTGTLDGEDGKELKFESKKDGVTKIKLAPGTYVFHEEAAPAGYKTVNDITFKVDSDGKVTVTDINGNKQNLVNAEGKRLAVIDEKDSVVKTLDGDIVVEKIDQYGQFVVGAKLRITKKAVAVTTASGSNATASASNAAKLNGNSITIGISKASRKIDLDVQNSGTVAEWTTENKAYTINLSEGNYILEEVNVPDGYKKADSVEFTIDANGNILVNGTVEEELVMVDEKISQPTSDVRNDSKDDNKTTNDNGSKSRSSSSSSSSSSGGGSSSSGGSSGGGSGSSSLGGPGVVTKIIDNQATPQAGSSDTQQDTTDVSMSNRPLGELPKTADGTNDLIWIFLGLLSMGGIAAVYMFDKKKLFK